jgi:hypothetical protein
MKSCATCEYFDNKDGRLIACPSGKPVCSIDNDLYKWQPKEEEASERRQKRLNCYIGNGVNNWRCEVDCSFWNGKYCDRESLESDEDIKEEETKVENSLCKTCVKENCDDRHRSLSMVGCSGHVSVSKTYTTGQMVDMLLENPKRKAESLDGLTAEWVEADGRLIKCEGTYGFNITSHDKDRKWTIIEPEPEQVELWQALKAILKTGIIIVSCVTNKEYEYLADFAMHATDEELQGKWIVKEAGV